MIAELALLMTVSAVGIILGAWALGRGRVTRPFMPAEPVVEDLAPRIGEQD